MESALKTLAQNCNWKRSNERQSKCDADQYLKYTERANVAVDVLQYPTAAAEQPLHNPALLPASIPFTRRFSILYNGLVTFVIMEA